MFLKCLIVQMFYAGRGLLKCSAWWWNSRDNHWRQYWRWWWNLKLKAALHKQNYSYFELGVELSRQLLWWRTLKGQSSYPQNRTLNSTRCKGNLHCLRLSCKFIWWSFLDADDGNEVNWRMRLSFFKLLRSAERIFFEILKKETLKLELMFGPWRFWVYTANYKYSEAISVLLNGLQFFSFVS